MNFRREYTFLFGAWGQRLMGTQPALARRDSKQRSVDEWQWQSDASLTPAWPSQAAFPSVIHSPDTLTKYFLL